MNRTVAIFFYHYEPLHETKEVGQIALGLADIGVGVTLVTAEKESLRGYRSPVPLLAGSDRDIRTEEFWRRVPGDTVLFLYGNGYYREHFQAITAAGKKIIVKLDSNGRIWYPLHWFGSEMFRGQGTLLQRFGRVLKWGFPVSRRAIVGAELEQFGRAAAVTVESPKAKSNIAYLLSYWGRADLIPRVHFVPSPVTQDIASGAVAEKRRNRVVVTAGRLREVTAQKNAEAMFWALGKFLERQPQYRGVIAGSGRELAESLIGRFVPAAHERIEFTGSVDHARIRDILAGAKIVLMPSRWESFGLSAAEGVCSGCSIVATPVEPLEYLTHGGLSGTIAANFSREAVLAALIEDRVKWERGEYDPQRIAGFWRERLNRARVAQQYCDIAESIAS